MTQCYILCAALLLGSVYGNIFQAPEVNELDELIRRLIALMFGGLGIMGALMISIADHIVTRLKD